MNGSNLRRKRGTSLIEMTIVMSAFSVLMVINARWLHQSIKFASTMKQQQRQHQCIKTLASQFRKDVRQGNSIRMASDNDQQLVVTHSPTSQCRYTIDGTVVRFVSLVDSAVVQRDSFPLGDNAVAHWDTSELPEWISLSVSRSPKFPRKQSNDHQAPRSPEKLEMNVRVGPNPWQTLPASTTHSAEASAR